MRRFFLLLITFHFSLFSALAQPSMQWAKCFGGKGNDVAQSMIQTYDGGYLIVGSTNSLDGDVAGLHDSLGSRADYWLIKLDSNGILLWQKCIGGSDKDSATCLIQTKDSGYAICGYSWSDDGDVAGNNYHYSADFWVVKLSSQDSIQWQKTYGGYQDDKAYSIIQTYEGGYMVAGNTMSPDGNVTGYHGATDYWIIKLDSLGNLIWNKCYGGSGDETAKSIVQTFDGGYIICGFTDSDNGDVTGLNKDNSGNNTYDIWIVKTDSAGEILWEKTYGGMQNDYGCAIIQTKDSGYAIFGTCDFGKNDSGYYFYDDYCLIKIAGNGAIEWQQRYGGSNYDEASSMTQTNDGGFLLAGYTLSNDYEVSGNHGGYDAYIVKTDSLGNYQWSKCYGGSRDDVPYSIVQTKDGGYAFAGSTFSNDGDVFGWHDSCILGSIYLDSVCTNDFWIVKLYPYDPIKIVAPQNTSVYVYPNPFYFNTTLLFKLDSLPENCVLNIYEITGQQVRSLAITDVSNSINIYRDGLSKGFYICELIENGITVLAVGKLIID